MLVLLSYLFNMAISQCSTAEVLIYYLGLPFMCILHQNIIIHLHCTKIRIAGISVWDMSPFNLKVSGVDYICSVRITGTISQQTRHALVNNMRVKIFKEYNFLQILVVRKIFILVNSDNNYALL